MRTLKNLIAVVVVAVAAVAATPAQAQFRFGPKVGLNVNKLHFNESTFSGTNNSGFTAGAMVEFTAPIIGVGVDLSAMYVRRTAEFMRENARQFDRRDYIDIPLNLKWKLNIPIVNNIIRP